MAFKCACINVDFQKKVDCHPFSTVFLVSMTVRTTGYKTCQFDCFLSHTVHWHAQSKELIEILLSKKVSL